MSFKIEISGCTSNSDKNFGHWSKMTLKSLTKTLKSVDKKKQFLLFKFQCQKIIPIFLKKKNLLNDTIFWLIAFFENFNLWRTLSSKIMPIFCQLILEFWLETWKWLTGHSLSVAEVFIRVGCGTRNSNFKMHLICMHSTHP